MLSDELEKTLQRAMDKAIKCEHQFITLEHLLYALLEDVETILEENSRLLYKDRNNADQYTQQITIVSIDTDEGVLEPMGVGEMLVEVRY